MRQLAKEARVKGRGMEAADFVWTTVFKAESGLANMPIVSRTPHGPIKADGLEIGDMATKRVAAMMESTDTAWRRTEPGKEGAALGELRIKLIM